MWSSMGSAELYVALDVGYLDEQRFSELMNPGNRAGTHCRRPSSFRLSV
jgi:hypothetical protein